MNAGSPFIASAQPSELVQPCQGSLHYPPMDAQATPVLGVRRLARTGSIPSDRNACRWGSES